VSYPHSSDDRMLACRAGDLDTISTIILFFFLNHYDSYGFQDCKISFICSLFAFIYIFFSFSPSRMSRGVQLDS
jgi:hypothetical protein